MRACLSVILVLSIFHLSGCAWFMRTEHPEPNVLDAPAKESLDSIGIERDVPRRLEMLNEFYTLYLKSSYLPDAVAIELRTYADEENDTDLLSRVQYWQNAYPDSPKILTAIVSARVNRDLPPEETFSIIEHILRIHPRKSTGDPKFNLLEARTLISLNRFDEARHCLETGRNTVKDNNSGLEAEYALRLGQVKSAQDDSAGAIHEFIRCAVLGAPRNRWVPDAMDALNGLFEGKSPVDLLHGCRNSMNYTGPVFTDVTEETGLSNLTRSRVSWGDADNDGFMDILLDGSVLLHNRAGYRFVDISEDAGLEDGFHGGLWADIDNDGDSDLFVLSHGDTPETGDRIYTNNGDLTFTHQDSAGVADVYRTEGAAWGDYNGDGSIDLYVANYEMAVTETQAERGRGTPDFLYKNAGDGRFIDVTRPMGIDPEEDRCGRGVAWSDYDNDGDADIFVSNYRLQENFLWRNDGDHYTNSGLELGLAGTSVDGYWGHTIGSSWADINNDGFPEIFCANLAHPRYIEFSDVSGIFYNPGRHGGKFLNKTSGSGISFDETHSDPAWCDVDNDGDLDLFITSIYTNERSYLYLNLGNGTFSDVTFLSGARVYNGWGCAFADYNNDGRMDLLVGSSSGVRLLRNDTLNHHHWLQIQVTGKFDNSDGFGCRIRIDQNGSIQYRDIQGGRGTTSQDSSITHFGLGKSDDPVKIHVTFPSGDVLEMLTEHLDVMTRIFQ